MNTKNTNLVIASPDILRQLLLDMSIHGFQINEQPAEVYDERHDSNNVSAEGEKINTYMCNGIQYISRLNTARLIGVAPSTLWHWQKAGILIPIKFGNKKVHYRYEDVIALLNGSTRTHENH